ncbi:MAG TPA: PD-(D/E)XK nuclease family protein [Usitatibacter sp.]|nr:PD-(D/E)XK nuclease family protein [Usitatibacter sp.]
MLTPNLRLARALAREFDREQAGRGLSTWESADILTFGAFVQRAWEDAVYSAQGAAVPLLLTPAQEQALWEETLRAADAAERLVALAPAAAQCRDAWKLAHGWRIASKLRDAQSVDTRAFADWSSRYERATREKGQTDAARLPDVIAPLLANPGIRLPRIVALHGFDQMTPQAGEFIAALASRGIEVVEVAAASRASRARRIELTEAKDEIDAAARWARARLEANPHARIGVVVPELARSRARVQRIFARTMRPDHLVTGGAAAPPFEISLGQALADFPIVADALLVLELASGGAPFEHASRVVRSPFIAGADSELGVRARLDERLRRRCGPYVSLTALARQCNSPNAPRAAALVAALDGLAKFHDAGLSGRKGLSEWAKGFSEALRIMGFPGERTLDSAESQALAKWHEALGELATVERVVANMDCDGALRRIEQLARDTIFQPEGADAPILVAGILESAGLEFDHLWVMGLTDDAWPLPARPNPFVPVAMQRAAGVPQADPSSSLELDRRITQGWSRAAGEVVFSHSKMRGESELSPSPLIAALPRVDLEDLSIAPAMSLRDAIRRAGTIESIDDARAPPSPAGVISGGTGLFRDQGACPFRAFAKYRIACSDPPESPQPGLDPRDRGTIVHEMLKELWRALESKRRLDEASPGELRSIVEASVDKAIESVKRYRADVLGGAFGRLERARLVRVAYEWLDVERRRMDFSVVVTEEKKPATFGGVTVNVKLDRMDDVPGAGHFVIDYKTGKASASGLMLPRPDEPQLPMYALSRENVAAVAFAQVRTGEMEFRGLAKVEKIAKGVEQAGKGSTNVARFYSSWNDAMTRWRAELESLGTAFASGDARVDPKRGAETCKQCEQQPFCRIAEKSAFGAVKKAEDDD